MTTAVLFDLDGTLLDRHHSLIVYLHQLTRRFDNALADVDILDFIDKVVEFDSRGYVTKDVVFQKVEAHFRLPANTWRRLFQDFQQFFPDTCVGFPRMHQTLLALKEQGFPLGLITNGSCGSQNPKIDGLGIRHYFQAVLVSEAEGVKKPDPEIFSRALAKLGVAAKNAIFVGDNPKADIEGAKGAGMRAIWFVDPYWPEPQNADATISQLCQLPDVLGRMDQERVIAQQGDAPDAYGADDL